MDKTMCSPAQDASGVGGSPHLRASLEGMLLQGVKVKDARVLREESSEEVVAFFLSYNTDKCVWEGFM